MSHLSTSLVKGSEAQRQYNKYINIAKKRVSILNKNTVLDNRYYITIILNIFLLIGLMYISIG